jgi:hypothetical protein
MIWRIGLYKVDSVNNIFNLESIMPVHLIGAEGLRLNKLYPSTCADPFLFARNNHLYLFYELKTDHGQGEIYATELSFDLRVKNLGCILKEHFHLSYPQVFEHNNEIYMLPETAQAGRVILYKAKMFPYEWERHTTLLDDVLLDPTLLNVGKNNIYLFGTTRSNSLVVFRVDDDLKIKHIAPLVSSVDSWVARCGGSPLNLDGSFVRVAQINITKYGESVNFYKINSLQDVYIETLIEGKKVFTKPPSWASEGHHHISIAHFKDKIYVAVDGYARDKYYNTILYALIVIRKESIRLIHTLLQGFLWWVRRHLAGTAK